MWSFTVGTLDKHAGNRQLLSPHYLIKQKFYSQYFGAGSWELGAVRLAYCLRYTSHIELI